MVLALVHPTTTEPTHQTVESTVSEWAGVTADYGSAPLKDKILSAFTPGFPHGFAIRIPESIATPPAEIKDAYAEKGRLCTPIGSLVDHMDSLNVENWVESRRFYNYRIPLQFPPGYVGIRIHQTCLFNQGLYAQDDYIGRITIIGKLQENERLCWVDDEGFILAQCPQRDTSIEGHGRVPTAVFRWDTEASKISRTILRNRGVEQSEFWGIRIVP